MGESASQAADLPATCSTGNGFITLKRQLSCPTTAPCDWVLRLTKGTTAGATSANAIDPAAGSSSSNLNDLEVWTELSADSLTSTVLAQVIDPDGLPVAEPIVVSPEGTAFQKLPVAARDGLGNFFVAWEAENSVTGLDEIFARRYDISGNPLGEVFTVSQPADSQQAEPSVTADPTNNVAVSWTRYALEDEPGEIEIQIFDVMGAPTGDTIGLPPDPGGVATMSLVQADGQGNLWVAWTVKDRRNEGGDVYAQRILRGGIAAGRPFRVSTTHAGVRRLAALRVQRDGSFRVIWEGLGARGQGKGLRERRYDAQGRPAGEEAPVSTFD